MADMTTALCPNSECQSYNQSVWIVSVRDSNDDFLNYACEWCSATIDANDITWATGEGPAPDET